MMRVVLCCLLIVFAPLAAANDERSARVDKLFTAWDKADTPGAALAVVRDGQIIYRRAYGLAQLEYRVPNTPATVFHAASVSKQFTAFAIHLLVQDGKLALDDEVRKYLPELQVQGPPITLRHLLHHTSGLRDQWDLLRLAGLRMDDVLTEGDILTLLWQQKQLNFAPGEEHLYSNSGYTLLGLIVKRVSGQTLAAFAQERIFGPLGMKSTHFHENYGTLVPGRAYSYRRIGNGYQYVALSFSNVGATSLFTTVEDLALWDANATSAKVGGAAVQAAMPLRGRLNNGRDIDYASGLYHGRHRGLPTIEHSGVDAGYRAHLLRYPEQRFSVLLLGNAADMNTNDLARRVADIYLEATSPPERAQSYPAEVELDAAALRPYLGDFEMRPGFVLSFTAQGKELMVQASGRPKFALFASASDQFFVKAFAASVKFDAPGSDGLAATALWLQGGNELPLKRVNNEPLSAQALHACAGDYYSEELRALYRLWVLDGKLMLRYARGELELKPTSRDIFSSGAFPLGSIKLQRNATNECNGFAVSTARVRSLEFRRVNLVAVP